jgi:hypothetical protein
LKTELIYRHSWTSRHHAELAMFTWIEGCNNAERMIADLGMRSRNETKQRSTLTLRTPT